MRAAFALGALAVPGAWCGAQPLPRYVLTDLGTLGGTYSTASGINDLGQICGGSTDASGRSKAFRTKPYAPINPLTDHLGDMGGDPPDCDGARINSSGVIVGTGWTADGYHAGFALANGGFSAASDMGTFGGWNSYGQGINDAGEIVGVANTFKDSPFHAFRTSSPRAINPTTDDLGTLGGRNSVAFDINNAGVVVGGSDVAGNTARHAFRTAPHAAIKPGDDIGTLGGGYTDARAVNESGMVAGVSQLSGSSILHAFRTPAGAVINPATDDLGSFGGNTFPGDLSDDGTVVGSSAFADGTTHAFVSFNGQPIVDLNSLVIDPPAGWTLAGASGINSSGAIVGGAIVNGDTRAFLLTPVPEATSLGIPAAAAGALATCRRRRRRQR